MHLLALASVLIPLSAAIPIEGDEFCRAAFFETIETANGPLAVPRKDAPVQARRIASFEATGVDHPSNIAISEMLTALATAGENEAKNLVDRIETAVEDRDRDYGAGGSDLLSTCISLVTTPRD